MPDAEQKIIFPCDQTYEISLRPEYPMKKLKFTFKNAAGEELAGLLELPENPKAFALLAHCFYVWQRPQRRGAYCAETDRECYRRSPV
jgi:hypothetical protein